MTRTLEEEEDEMEATYTFGRKKQETVGRINRRGEWEKTTVETDNRETGTV